MIIFGKKHFNTDGTAEYLSKLIVDIESLAAGDFDLQEKLFQYQHSLLRLELKINFK